MGYCFGVDIGGTTVKLGFFREDGALLDKWEIPTKTENEGMQILPDIAGEICGKLEEKGLSREECIGIGVGVPAPVTAEGVVNGSANLGWKHKEVKREMEERTGITTVVGNDANVAALGEMWKGAGKGCTIMAMITLGTGVGTGFIVNGRMLVGENGAAGEGGHICVNFRETKTCGCGNRGCLEQYASATGIVRMAKEKLEGETRETLLKAETVTAKDVFDALKQGDKVAEEVVEQFGEYLGSGLAGLAAVTDPALFVIGGGVSKAGDIILPYISESYRRRAFFAHKNAGFVLATLGNDAGIYGAAKLALNQE